MIIAIATIAFTAFTNAQNMNEDRIEEAYFNADNEVNILEGYRKNYH